jgi:hypothetical protein
VSFLKNLLKPKSAIRMAFDPAGGTISAGKHGGDAGQGLLDPSGMIIKQGDRMSAPNDPTANPADQSGSYFGDQADPGYGSFTKPFDAEEFYKYQDPGYWFRLQQGEQGVRNAAAAGSGALSGAALKDLLGYNQDMASTEYGNAFNRYQTTQGNIFSRLMGIAGLGQNAAAGVGNQGTALAGNAGQFLSNAGTATGSGIVGGANAITGGATNAWLWNQMNQQPRPIAAGTGGV